MGNDVPREMSALAQNEVTFAVLRDAVVDDMLVNGKEAVLRSKVTPIAGGGMRVETSGPIDAMLKDFTIQGNVTGESVAFNQFQSGFRLPSPGTHVVGDFTVGNMKGQVLERDRFEFFGSEKNYQFDRADLATIGITRTDASGTVIQKMNPAISEEKIVGGRYAYDANNQPIRVARLSGGDANCGKENIANPGNRRTECNWLVDDTSTKMTYSYNQTYDRGDLRSVIRVGETPRAIVHQLPEYDKQGNLIAVTTSIRPVIVKKN